MIARWFTNESGALAYECCDLLVAHLIGRRRK